jgi:6-pyruvoyltetrahydropterin/6-carboxytetrahydropterin synthase
VVRIKSPVVNDIGIAYDFMELKQHLADVIARFDHTCLNDVPPFNQINPSSENIAATIYKELQPKLTGAEVSIVLVEVWESPESGVSYSPD